MNRLSTPALHFPSECCRYQSHNSIRIPALLQTLSDQISKAYPPSVTLVAHGSYYGMTEKYAKLKTATTNPFIDPEGYPLYVLDREQASKAELEKQRLK